MPGRVSTEQRASPSLLDEIPWYKTSRNGFLIYYALSSNFWWENPSTEQHERSWLHHTPSSYIAQQYIAVKTQIIVTIFFKSDSPTTIHTYACIIRQIRYCTIIWTKKHQIVLSSIKHFILRSTTYALLVLKLHGAFKGWNLLLVSDSSQIDLWYLKIVRLYY